MTTSTERTAAMERVVECAKAWHRTYHDAISSGDPGEPSYELGRALDALAPSPGAPVEAEPRTDASPATRGEVEAGWQQLSKRIYALDDKIDTKIEGLHNALDRVERRIEEVAQHPAEDYTFLLNALLEMNKRVGDLESAKPSVPAPEQDPIAEAWLKRIPQPANPSGGAGRPWVTPDKPCPICGATDPKSHATPPLSRGTGATGADARAERLWTMWDRNDCIGQEITTKVNIADEIRAAEAAARKDERRKTLEEIESKLARLQFPRHGVARNIVNGALASGSRTEGAKP